MGRPSSFKQETAETICTRLAEGESLRAICKDDGMPSMASVFRWLGDESNHSFREQYARAREAQAEHMAEEILEIADDGINDRYIDDNGAVKTDSEVIGRSRLRVDARKWLLSKMAPKKYGDKIDVGVGNKDGETFKIDEGQAAAKLAAIMAAAAARKQSREGND